MTQFTSETIDARIANQSDRVAFLGALRDIVARRCPCNKVGAAIVSDYDMIWSDAVEREEAWAKVESAKRRTTP